MIKLLVNEDRLDQLLINARYAPCPDSEELINKCNKDFDCKACWKQFVTDRQPAPSEKPIMIQMVSEQLFALRNKPE